MRKDCYIISHTNKRAWFALGFFFIFCSAVFSQDAKLADSLETVYTTGAYEEKDKLIILQGIAINHGDPEKSLIFSIELLQTAYILDSLQYFFVGLLQKGNALKAKGDYSKAMESYFEAAEIAARKNNNLDLGMVYTSIADVYSLMENQQNAIKYYRKSIVILREENDSSHIATALYNAGDFYYKIEKYDSAMANFNESSLIFRNINSKLGGAFTLGSIGMVHAKQEKYDLAKEDIEQAILLCKEVGDYYAIPEFLLCLSDIYISQNDLNNAITYALKSLEQATINSQKKEISEANERLSVLYDSLGNYQLSNTYYRSHIVYRDSIKNIESVQELANLQTRYEISQKQMEVDLLNQQKSNQRIVVFATILALFLIGLLALTLFRKNKLIRATNKIIEEEQERSEKLLLNILPEETAVELKQNGKVKAKKFESITVLFTDFQRFTQFSQDLSPEKLVDSVDFYYSKFDEIMEKYKLEKIKTLGDSYMCAGGLHYHSGDHATKMIQAAFEIREFVHRAKKYNKENDPRFDIRIGVNTGAVVAGVVGTKKFAYDIWGDTVNVASRMETASEPGKINISEYTYELIKDHYDCTYRGERLVKNKGMMKMYFVNGVSS